MDSTCMSPRLSPVFFVARKETTRCGPLWYRNNLSDWYRNNLSDWLQTQHVVTKSFWMLRCSFCSHEQLQ